MSLELCPVVIELGPNTRCPTDVNARSRAEPAEVSLALRDKGWMPYRIWFNADEGVWIAAVLYRPDAA